MKFRIIVTVSFLLTSGLAFSEEGGMSSLIFFDYSYQTSENAPDHNGFEVKRAYFTFSKSVTHAIGFKIQFDVGRQKDRMNTNLYAYLKNALVKWKTDAGTFIFGLQGMNVFKIQEKTWGYRFIEKSAMDREKFASSADLGIGFSRKFAEKGFINAMITNGGGYKKPETDKYKKYSVLIGYGEQRLDKKRGFNAGVVFSYEPYKNGTVYRKQLIGFLAGFSVKKIRMGAELNIMDDSAVDKQNKLLSVYAVYKITERYQIFGRADRLDDGAENENYIIAGMVLVPAKSLMIAPNVRILEDGSSRNSFNVNFQYNF
ncbi:hypothetical protein DRQ07_03735 [candidate division KSB1 bacterium]|nr:MAG: hypothetical protein DRQ07_03735 [candidate division KSB1 bacterium]